MTGPALDPVVHATLRAGGACLLGAAAVGKLRDLAGFRAAVAGYALVPRRAAAPFAALAVAAELAIAVGLSAPGGARPAALAAVALLGVYTAAIAVNLARGRRAIDCGCGGPRRRPLGGGLVARNGVLIAGFALLALPVAPRAWSRLDVLTWVAATAALACSYAAAEIAAALAPPRTEAAR